MFSVERYLGKTVKEVKMEWEGYVMLATEPKPSNFDSRRLVVETVKTGETIESWTVVNATVG